MRCGPSSPALRKRKKKLLVAFDWVDIKGFQTLVASVVLKGRSTPITWASTTNHVYEGHLATHLRNCWCWCWYCAG